MSERMVLQVLGLHWATSIPAIEKVLLKRPGVEAVEANAANQTTTVTYDPARTSVAELSGWVRDCGFHYYRLADGFPGLLRSNCLRQLVDLTPANAYGARA